MDGNRRKLRNLLLYIGIPVAVLFIIIALFNSNRSVQQETYKYSDIIDYFQTGQVTEYKLNLGTGKLDMKLSGSDPSSVSFELPSVDLFYRDVSESITAYNQAHPDAKMVQDIIRPAETSWFYMTECCQNMDAIARCVHTGSQ